MKKVGLVLSGGGTRGMAHIGLLKLIDELGIKINMIAGTSAGALVGMMYACGMIPNDILQYFTKTSLFSIKNFSYNKPGFIDPLKFEGELIKLTSAKVFSDLKIPLHVITTNILTGEERVFKHGPLFKPILASASMPIVFAPVEIEGNWYADGGIVNNFPVDIIKDKNDFIIGSNVNTIQTIEKETIRNSLDVMERAFHILMSKHTQKNHQHCDIYLAPHALSNYGILDLNKIDEIFDIGYNHAKDKIAEFHPLFED